MLFLGTCQLALTSAAQLVVQHAANSAARSAIVILEDHPKNFGGAPRSVVAHGANTRSNLQETFMQRVNVNGLSVAFGPGKSGIGGRLDAIRLAAYVPLAILAPERTDPAGADTKDSVARALRTGTAAGLASAIRYNRAAAIVTLHAGGESDQVPQDEFERTASITVRVTYLYRCSIPIVRALACKALLDLRGTKPEKGNGFVFRLPGDSRTNEQKRLGRILDLAEDPKGLDPLEAEGARFVVIQAETTLPNQGAAYY
jgi:hypothetical protein